MVELIICETEVALNGQSGLSLHLITDTVIMNYWGLEVIGQLMTPPWNHLMFSSAFFWYHSEHHLIHFLKLPRYLGESTGTFYLWNMKEYTLKIEWRDLTNM